MVKLDHFPKGYKIAFLAMCGILIIALVFYSFSVYLESQVLHVGEKTCDLQEENHDLELHLEQLKSFHHVSASTKRIKGLAAPEEIIHVACPDTIDVSAPKAPTARIPISVYGY